MKKKRSREKLPKTHGKEVCIVCQKEKKGAAIVEDFVIKGLRKIKQSLKASTGYKLVVCEDCKEVAKKKRQNFERTLLTYMGLGGIVLLAIIITAVMSGGSILSIIQSIIVLIFLIVLLAALSLLNYFPSFKGYKAKEIKKTEKGKAKK